jgi:hypothetical protein
MIIQATMRTSSDVQNGISTQIIKMLLWRNRVAQQQAEPGHHYAHQKGAPPKRHVNPALLVLPDDVFVGVIAPVYGVPVVA